jgi:hypothetical protein|tara:strand:+ start:81 stop:446 length:366 start_codon:yes stop_codon:yes gene_type:complete
MPFGARKNIGLFLGIVILIIGLIGVLSGINILKFQIPLTVNVVAWILALGGIYLIIESFTEFGMKRALALLVAFIVLVIASIPIMNQLGMITFSMPGISIFIYHILLTIEAVFLIINAFGT